MDVPIVRPATAAEEDAAVAVVVLAFSADPVARWCWPDPHVYLATMPAFTRAFAGGAFPNDTAYCCDDHAGAALWLPPGVHPADGTIDEIMKQTVPASVRDEFLGVFEQMASMHPTESHWYLPMIGVDPARQGRGCGEALMKYALERCDREGLPAYLESTNPRNRSLYRRHGFEALATIQRGASPPIVPMLRRPGR